MRNYKIKVKRNARKNILGMRVMFKKCTNCGKVLFRNEFYKTERHITKLSSSCKRCSNKSKHKCSCICKYCGKEFKGDKKNRCFCSKECYTKYNIAENNPKYNSVKCNCDYCGKEITVKKSHYDKFDNHFCNMECNHKWQGENWKGENNPNYKNGSVKCNCDYCGKEIVIKKSQYNNSKNHYCSYDCANKGHGENIKGENHPNYNPNITQEERELGRNYTEYRDWRKEVFERDNYTCQCCGDNKGHNLNAHHIYGYTEYKDLRTDVDNGVTLCEDCHKRYHKQYGIKNNNYKDFRTFLYNEMIKQGSLEARLFYINTIENITLRLESA